MWLSDTWRRQPGSAAVSVIAHSVRDAGLARHPQPAWAAADQAGQEDHHRRDCTGQSPSKVTDGAVESSWVESL